MSASIHPGKSLEEPLEYSPGTETILLVEDEQLLRELVAEMLGSLGYRVLSAASGNQAVAISETYPGEIHALISDVLMPELHGTSLAETLRRQRPSLKVLFVTGDINEMENLPANVARLSKPFTLKMLAKNIRELLNT
jgi:CheY-like chemotaxis protein